MNRNPLITVIVPVYNVELYLRRCMNSILGQTYSDLEVILVDDGSKDDSGKICDEFATKDCRVRVIHQDNAGAGAARNNGISQAKGEYVVFVDADDYIESHYFELLSKHTEDVVFIDVQCVDENDRKVKEEYLSCYKDWTREDLLRSQMTGKLQWGGVRKVVKRQLLKDNNIRYSNHRIGEEALYSYQVVHYAQSIGFIEGVVYSYLQHSDSLSNSRDEDPWGKVALSLRENIKQAGDYDKYAETLNAFIETAGVVKAYKASSYYPLKESVTKIKAASEWIQSEIDKNYPIDRPHESKKAKILAKLLQWRLYTVIWILSRLRGR